MRIIRAESYVAAPWKNGLGTTREILCHPDGAANFLYRLSIAEVTQSCEFSAFPGYDRTIMLLAGDGFGLRFADGRMHDLTTVHAPYPFDGGAPVSCTVADGPSQDLNLMVRRGAATAECSVKEIAGRVVLPPLPVHLIVALADGITVCVNGRTAELGRWDTVRIESADAPADEIICTSASTAPLFHAVVRVRDSAP